MSTSPHEPANYTEARPLPMPSPSPHSAYGARDADLRQSNTNGNLLEDPQSDSCLHGTDPVRSPKGPSFSVRQPAIRPLGKPRAKARISRLDLSVAAISLVCLAMAVTAVGNEAVSWRLGVANNQLIAVGFLLSIMNLCLASVTSTFCLLIEARFGDSILQNYDGILRNKPLAPRLGLRWRLVLTFFLIVPIAASVAYKSFKGGQSAKRVKSEEYVSILTQYGMVAVPGLMEPGQRPTGLPQLFNATQPFRSASAPVNDSEPRLPSFPQSYGYNVLLLDGNTTAVLDTLQPDFITSVQNVLAVGESWVVNAPVIGTIATLNTSKASDPPVFESAFQSACTQVSQDNGNWTQGVMNLWDRKVASSLWLFDKKGDRSDQSTQYVALAPRYKNNISCSGLAPHAELYNIYRQQCQGTWSITRAGMELTNGSCGGAPLPGDRQRMIVENTLHLVDLYIPALVDFLGAFGPFGPRNQSEWKGPYTATAVAAMLWSRLVALTTVVSSDVVPLMTAGGYNASTAAYENWKTSNGTLLSYGDVKLLYPVSPSDQTIFYIRPTLRKSPLFFLVLSVQPLMILAILGFTLTTHSVPLDKGFGLVSILSGIDRDTLDILSGASLSGELTNRVRLIIVPKDDGQTSKLDFRVMPEDRGSNSRGMVRKDVLYS